ncbi:MAG: hypothetical protein GX813_02400 [Erysipelotrichia bacterium]|nr:hypothetical protein [Erysipelotrichia bacterium]
MKRTLFRQIFFELASVVGSVAIGVTILTFIDRGVVIDKTFIAFVILLIGVIEIVNFLGVKDSVRMRNIPNMITDLIAVVLSLFLFFLNMQLKTVLLIWAITYLTLYTARTVINVINFKYKPLFCGVKIVLAVILMVYMIILLVLGESFIITSMSFIGYALLIEAVMLLVEFLIHHYQ